MRLLLPARFSSALALVLAGALLVLVGCDSGGSPAEELGDNTAFSFAAESDTVSESVGSYELSIQIDDPGFRENSVEVIFDEEASTLERSELVGFTEEDMTVRFEESATAGQAATVSFGIADDDTFDEGAETAVFRLEAPGSGSISQGAFTLVVTDDDTTIPIAEAREREDGAVVPVKGIVTRVEGSNVRIQDPSGEGGATGIVVRSDSLASAIERGDVSLGDRIVAIGGLGNFSGLRQISSDVRFQVAEEEAGVPEPQVATLEELNASGEAYESELVRVEDLYFTDASGTFEGGTTYTVQNEAGTTFDLRVQGSVTGALAGMEIPLGAFTFEGVLGQFTAFGDLPPDAGYQLIPTRPSDIEATGGGVRFAFAGRSYALAYEEGNAPASAPAATVTVRALGLAEGQEARVTVTASSDDGGAGGGNASSELVGGPERTLTFNGPGAQTVTFEAAPDGEEEGVEALTLMLTTEDGVAVSAPRTLWILDDPAAQAALFAGTDGGALVEALQDRYAQPPAFDDYGAARDTLYSAVYSEDGSSGSGGIVRGFYTGYEATLPGGGGDPSSALFEQGINAEHTWPQSKGADADETPAGRDLHILVPAWEAANSARCNYPYDDIDDEATERWFGASGGTGEVLGEPPATGRDAYSEAVGNDCGNPSAGGRFEPRESVKGDVARKVFYFRTVWPEQADEAFFERQRATLLAWNAQDPPSPEEARRNVIAATFQGRVINPFVVDPSLAERAYGGNAGGEE